MRVYDGVKNKLADWEEGLSYSSCLSMCLAIYKVFGRIGTDIRVFRCKLGHFGANSSKYFMNRQVGYVLRALF